MDDWRIDIHNEVYLTQWNKEWARTFHLEKQGIIGSMIAEDHYGAVYHVGSTSIEGMVAKPIIDILVCPNDDVPVEDVIPDLERIGYKNLGDGGRPGRYFLPSRVDQKNKHSIIDYYRETFTVSRFFLF